MREAIGTFWWLFAVAGALTLIFGTHILTSPTLSPTTVAFYFGFLALACGLPNLYLAAHHLANRPRILFGINGIVDLILFTVVILFPQQVSAGMMAAFSAFLVLMAIWTIFTGAIELLISFDNQDNKLLAFAGTLGVLLGVIIVFNPLTTGLAFSQTVGAFISTAGVLYLLGALGLKHLTK